MTPLNFRQLVNAKNLNLPCICGCTKYQLRMHIQAQFKPGMTWWNYGIEWEIDHITPLSFFEEMRGTDAELHHFSNLQPLWTWENHAKLNRMGKVRSPDHPIVRAERKKQEAHHKSMADKWGAGWQRLKAMTVFESGDWTMEPTFI